MFGTVIGTPFFFPHLSSLPFCPKDSSVPGATGAQVNVFGKIGGGLKDRILKVQANIELRQAGCGVIKSGGC